MNASKVIAVVVLLAALVAGVLFLPVRAGFVHFEAYVRSLGAVGPLAVILVYILATVFFIPGSVITVAAGTLFGLKTGLVVVILGANLGALSAFLLARTFLRQKVAAWAAGQPKFRSLDQAIGKHGFKMVLLTRLSPVFPFILLNYFLGLTAVRLAAYIPASFLGMLPATFLFVYIGAAARDALAGSPDATADFYQQVLRYVGLAATVAVVVVVTRLARRALRAAEQEQEGSLFRPRLDENLQPMRYDEMLLADDPHDRKLIENCRAPGRPSPSPSGRYNLVVIGGGTAGLVSAAGAAGLGAKVALIERNLLGGDCLNVGCVPSKALIRAARAVYETRAGAEFGVRLECEPKAAFGAAMERMRRLRAEISRHDSVERFARLGVDVFIGAGRFAGADAVEVDGQRLAFDRAVIATGARAAELPVPGLREAGYLTNETVFKLTDLPRRLAVIGAGPIGCELAQSFARFGSKVFLIEALHGVLPNEDADASEIVRRAMIERDDVELRCCGKELKIAVVEGGGKRLTFESHESRYDIVVDEILVGGGRKPNLEGLGLELAGVEFNAQGVVVDERLRTSNPRIFAAGDVCSRYKFTHAADAMARIVIANALFMARRKVADLVIPWCTYTDPEVAHVGYYEDDARQAGFEVATITQPLREVDRALLDGEDDGFARVHYDKKSAKILGGTIVARHAGEMIGELALAITAKQNIAALSATIHPYPTQAEALRKIGDAYMRTRLTPAVRKIFGKWLEWRRRQKL